MSRDACAGHADGFVGLRSLEAPARAQFAAREVGIIVHHSKVVSGLVDTFEADWSAKETIESAAAAGRAARAQEEPQGEHEEALAARSSGEEAFREDVSKTDGSATLTTREMKDTV